MEMPDSDEFQDPLADDSNLRPTTKGLVERIVFDQPLTRAEIQDFGVSTPDHYRALKEVFFYDDTAPEHELGKRMKELDQALGNGQKIMALVQKYAPQYADVTFKTCWDELRESESKLRAANKHQQGR